MRLRRPHRRWYGLLYIYALLWLAFLALHFGLAYLAYADEQAEHGQPFQWGSYLVEWGRQVAENDQSEVFQLLLQSAFNSALATSLFLVAEASLSRCEVLLRYLVTKFVADPDQVIRDADPDLLGR